MKKYSLTIFSLFVSLSLLSCQSTTNSQKPKTAQHIKDAGKNQNSYYYFLLSQLTDMPGNELQSDQFLDWALKKNKESGYLLGEKSLREARKNNLPEALKDALLALTKDPQNKDHLLLVGKIYAASKQPDQAIPYYQKAQNLDPDNEEIYNVMAREYLTLKNQGGAVASLKSCLNHQPESLSCLYYLATIYTEAKDLDAALPYYNTIAELTPDNPKILDVIAGIYLQQKNNDKAIEILTQLKKIEPNDLGSQIKLGLLYSEMKQTDKAIGEFQSVAQRFPESDRINYFLGLLYTDKKDYDNALKVFDRIKSDSKFYMESIIRQGLILKEQRKISAAVDLIDRKLSKKEKTAQWYDLKASFLVFENDYKKALSLLTEGLELFKNNEDLLFQRAIVFDKMNQWDEARKDLEALIQINPQSAKAFNYLGYTMAEKNEDLNQAMAYVQKAHNLKPNDGYIIDSLGWVYFKSGNANQALSLLAKAQKMVPDEPTVSEHLGDIYLSLKNKNLSRVYYEKAVTILSKIAQRNPDEEKQLKGIQGKLGGF